MKNRILRCIPRFENAKFLTLILMQELGIPAQLKAPISRNGLKI
jgi:hypothetical protein